MRRLAIASLLLLACAGASPSEPVFVQTIPTDYGTVSLEGNADASEVRAHIENGFSKAAYQGYQLRATGIRVLVIDSCQVGGVPCAGYHSGNDLYMLNGHPSVLEHEVQHWAAWRLGRVGECYRCQDHCGGDSVCSAGYNLDCEVCGGGGA